MTSLSARLILVNFSLKKKSDSNGSKPIRVLINPNLSSSDLRIPLCYSLPDFQPNRSNSLSQPPPPPWPEGRGSTRKKTVPIRLLEKWESFAMTKLLAIWFLSDLWPILINFRSTLAKTKNCSKMNVRPLYANNFSFK